MTSPTATSALGAGALFDGPSEGAADGPADRSADGLPDGLPDGEGVGRVLGVLGVLGEGRTAEEAMTARPLFRSKDAIVSADFAAGRPLAPPGRATALGVPPPASASAARTASCGTAVDSAAAGSAPEPAAAGAPDPGPAHPATSSEAVATASKGAIPERANLVDLRTVGS
ncbi:hypothetical protein [Streptomyces sp. GS7]|uniref:hypothetical protein n=1 Tax=Streptomyces sp. GS7 TaxID=2692234 RepID=UPI002E2A5F72|nr:hypothetical protein [Streptomyces sp. GS7]